MILKALWAICEHAGQYFEAAFSDLTGREKKIALVIMAMAKTAPNVAGALGFFFTHTTLSNTEVRHAWAEKMKTQITFPTGPKRTDEPPKNGAQVLGCWAGTCAVAEYKIPTLDERGYRIGWYITGTQPQDCVMDDPDWWAVIS